MRTTKPLNLLGIDIAVRAATGQLEAIRVASNLIVLLGLAPGGPRRAPASLLWMMFTVRPPGRERNVA